VKAYFIYRNEVFEDMKEQNKSMNKGDLAELISNNWDRLDKVAKQEYEERYQKDMDQYKKDLESYEKKYGVKEPKEDKKPEQKDNKE
jgi:hypothetical protein